MLPIIFFDPLTSAGGTRARMRAPPQKNRLSPVRTQRPAWAIPPHLLVPTFLPRLEFHQNRHVDEILIPPQIREPHGGILRCTGTKRGRRSQRRLAGGDAV